MFFSRLGPITPSPTIPVLIFERDQLQR